MINLRKILLLTIISIFCITLTGCLYGRFRTGVAYAIDGKDLSNNLFTTYIPLEISNWYFYKYTDNLELMSE